MLEIITTVAIFGNWRDCYLYMNEEGMEEIKIIAMRLMYMPGNILGSCTRTIKEVKQMSEM